MPKSIGDRATRTQGEPDRCCPQPCPAPGLFRRVQSAGVADRGFSFRMGSPVGGEPLKRVPLSVTGGCRFAAAGGPPPRTESRHLALRLKLALVTATLAALAAVAVPAVAGASVSRATAQAKALKALGASKSSSPLIVFRR